MPKKTFSNRFLVLFLLLAFLLINMAVLPIFLSLSASNSENVSQPENSSGSTSLSLGIFNSFDYLDAENMSYVIGSSQSFQTRRLIEERFVSLSSALPRIYSDITYYTLSSEELYGFLCLNKITEFLHAKDGML